MLKSSALTVLFHRDMRVSCKYEKRGRVNIRNPSLILCNQSFNLSPILLHSILNVNVVGLNYSLLSPFSLSSNSGFSKFKYLSQEMCKILRLHVLLYSRASPPRKTRLFGRGVIQTQLECAGSYAP